MGNMKKVSSSIEKGSKTGVAHSQKDKYYLSVQGQPVFKSIIRIYRDIYCFVLLFKLTLKS